MTLMRRRAALVLGLAVLFASPAGALADPPTQSTSAQPEPVTAPPDTTGQSVTIVIPHPKPRKKPTPKAAAKTVAATTPTPSPTAPAAIPRRPQYSRRPGQRPHRLLRVPTAATSHSVRGGASIRVAAPPARGAGAVVVETSASAVPLEGFATATPAVASSAASDATSRGSRNWAAWVVGAIVVLEALVLARFAYRRWSRRRSLRRATQNLLKAPAVRAGKDGSYGRRPVAKRWRH